MTISIVELKKRILELLKTDEEFRYAVAGLIGLKDVLDELRKLREDIGKLYEKSLEHDKRFEVIGKKLLEHDKRFEEMNKRFEAIERKLLEHDRRFDNIINRLNRIELELEALNESFYCKALWDDLREEIQGKGEKLVMRKRNAKVDEEDIDLLVVTNRSVYVIEVKVEPKHEDVGRIIAKADVVRKHYEDKIIVPILAGTMIGREVEEYAQEKGVKVYNY